ncbi:hypothetical protein D9599_06685 [Roseomonas sp. KE2513]|uniref:hypothetical protein n=1 Tax=Roseomonas sp. KE2513 TaxID=2479202 RepID=UPI0018DF87A4|nr:hypothetical protein [Roseomonas sp. KE2513]MBI0535252.1 hypothetical protein [Roseomonas sp. KE2513]
MAGTEAGIDRVRAVEAAVRLSGEFGAVEHSIQQMHLLMECGQEAEAALWVELAFTIVERGR